jgi:hypothetical protein
MFLRGTNQRGMKGRRAAMFATAMVAFLSVPAIMYSHINVVSNTYEITGAPGQAGGCAVCHGTLTTPSMVTVNAPSSYTAGQTVNMTVTIPSSGAFELTVLSTPANAAAGTLSTTDANASRFTAGGVQFIGSTNSATSWTFSWVAPASGNVVLYVTGGTFSTTYLNSYTITGPAAGPPPTPTLDVNGSTTPTGLTFTAQVGGTAPSQNVSVTASDGSGLAFSAAATVTSPTGGTWLSVGSASGTTPDTTEAISVTVGSLAAGTYTGNVTFSSTATSNTSVMLPVTLTVTTNTPPTGETFSLTVVDRQSGGADYLLLYGSGDTTPTGGGSFTRFRSGTRSTSGDTRTTIVSKGTWKPTSVTTNTSGCLVLLVQLTTSGSSTPSTGTLTITDSSSSSGATLAITGATFNSVGVGSASIGTTPGTGCGSGTGGGTGGGGDDNGGTGSDERP